MLHLLDFHATRPNRGVPALLAVLGAHGPTRRWDVRGAAELPPHEGTWVLSGGPGSPFGDPGEELGWRPPVLEALRERVARDLPTLAICYGFELLGDAMRAEVRRLERPRLGGYRYRPGLAAPSDPLGAHLPDGAGYEDRAWGVFGGPGEVLAWGAEGDVVAVRYAPHVWGVIFHPEATTADLARLLADPDGRRLVEGRNGAAAARPMESLDLGAAGRTLRRFLGHCGHGPGGGPS